MPKSLPEITQQLGEAQKVMDQAITRRNDLVKLARIERMSFRRIGAAIGYSEARIRQIAAK